MPEKQKKLQTGRPLLRSRDKSLLKRADVACGLVGAESLKKDGSMAGVGEQHPFAVNLTGNFVLCGDGASLVPISTAAFVGLYPEGEVRWTKAPGARIRLVVLHAHFDPETNEINIGGSAQRTGSKEDGYHGFWVLPTGRVCLRKDVPEAYLKTARPADVYKDLRMISDCHPLSVFAYKKPERGADRRLERDENKRTRAQLTAALLSISAAAQPVSELEIPFTLVDRAGGMMDLRFLKGDIADVSNVTSLLVDVANSGLWMLPGLEDAMTAKEDGVVKDVGEDFISIEWSDGSGEMLKAPADQISQYIRERVHMKMANLPVVPLVEQGERFEKGTVLWGGCVGTFVDVPDFMRQNIPADVNALQSLQLLRAWAILAAGTHTAELEAYPLTYVQPRKASQLFFRPFVSRVALTTEPKKMLAVEDVGIRVDLFTSSHRNRYWRTHRAQKERAARRAKVQSA